jgi:predicted DNA-binding transcriptional regulator YafY
VLDDDEAVALVVGLQGAASVTVAGVAESSVSALTKVVQVMPPRLRRRVDAVRTMTVEAAWSGTGPAVDPEALTAVAQACRDAERLRFSYVSAAGDPSERDVEPHRLVRMGRRWYLVAYDLSRHDWRSFRLDRLQQPRSTGARFLPRTLPAQDAAEFVRAGLAQLPTQFVAEAEFDAPAADVRARVGAWAEIEDAGPDRCRLRMRTDSLDWAALALGSVGAEFRVVGPPELVEHLAGWAGRFARAVAPP